jgi:hypothetical protein
MNKTSDPPPLSPTMVYLGVNLTYPPEVKLVQTWS